MFVCKHIAFYGDFPALTVRFLTRKSGAASDTRECTYCAAEPRPVFLGLTFCSSIFECACHQHIPLWDGVFVSVVGVLPSFRAGSACAMLAVLFFLEPLGRHGVREH